MENTLRTWSVPTNTIRLKAVRLARKYLREGVSPSKARKMASKEVGYSVASIYAWEKQFPTKGSIRKNLGKRTTTVIHSHKLPNNKTTTSTALDGIVVNHNLNNNLDTVGDQLRILSVDLVTTNGNIITLTEESVKNIAKIFS